MDQLVGQPGRYAPHVICLPRPGKDRPVPFGVGSQRLATAGWNRNYMDLCCRRNLPGSEANVGEERALKPALRMDWCARAHPGPPATVTRGGRLADAPAAFTASGAPGDRSARVWTGCRWRESHPCDVLGKKCRVDCGTIWRLGWGGYGVLGWAGCAGRPNIRPAARILAIVDTPLSFVVQLVGGQMLVNRTVALINDHWPLYA